MRRPVLLIFVNAMILIVVFALLSQSLVIVQRIAKADRINGVVEVQRSGKGEWKALSRGGLIKTGDVIRSGKNGTAEFKWADGTRWKVMPATEIVVKKSVYNMAKKADQSQLHLTTGKVFVRIMKALGPSSNFEVETPTAVAAVRGTIFSVEVKDGKTAVAVFKGEVKLSSEDGDSHLEEVVMPGKMAVSGVPANLCHQDSSAVTTDFQKQASIIQPQLDAEIKPLQGDRVIISGSTESGNTVTINQEKVRVLGNGTFLFRAPLKANKTFTVVSTDKHGARATKVVRAVTS